MAIIPYESSSFSEIKSSIDEYLTANQERYDILDNYEDSVRTMLVDLLAGFSSYLQYKGLIQYNNTFIRTAISKSAVMELAINRYGYNFNRALAPEINIICDVDNYPINTGDSFGSIPYNGEDMELIYFGSPKNLNLGDNIPVKIGIVDEITNTFLDMDFSKKIYVDIISQVMSIANDGILFYVNDVRVETTRDPEIYIIESKALDLSLYGNIARLNIYEESTNFGFQVLPTDTYKIKWIETPGRIPNLLNLIEKKANLVSEFHFDEILTYGANGDSLDKIRQLAPLYYTTFRVMSNMISHKTIATAYPGVLDVYVEKNPLECCTIDFYPLLDGSNAVPVEYLPAEKQAYVDFLSYYKFVGMHLGPENIKVPYAKVREWTVKVSYNCAKVRNREDMNSVLSSYIRSVVDKITLKLGVSFTLAEILTDISQYTYNGFQIIEDVVVFEDFDDYHALAPTMQYIADPKSYFYIDLHVEVGCK